MTWYNLKVQLRGIPPSLDIASVHTIGRINAIFRCFNLSTARCLGWVSLLSSRSSILWPSGIENNGEAAYTRLHPVLQITRAAEKNGHRAWPQGLDVCDKKCPECWNPGHAHRNRKMLLRMIEMMCGRGEWYVFLELFSHFLAFFF